MTRAVIRGDSGPLSENSRCFGPFSRRDDDTLWAPQRVRRAVVCVCADLSGLVAVGRRSADHAGGAKRDGVKIATKEMGMQGGSDRVDPSLADKDTGRKHTRKHTRKGGENTRRRRCELRLCL